MIGQLWGWAFSTIKDCLKWTTKNNIKCHQHATLFSLSLFHFIMIHFKDCKSLTMISVLLFDQLSVTTSTIKLNPPSFNSLSCSSLLLYHPFWDDIFACLLSSLNSCGHFNGPNLQPDEDEDDVDDDKRETDRFPFLWIMCSANCKKMNHKILHNI